MSDKTTFEISNTKLKIGLWVARHKVIFHKLFILFLGLSSIFFYFYTFIRLVDILIIHGKDNRAVMDNLIENKINFLEIKKKFVVLDLKVNFIRIFPANQGRKNIVAQIENPNDKYAASSVGYQFVSGGKVIAEDTSFIWPLEEKYFVALGIDSEDVNENDVRLEIKSISYKRFYNFNEELRDKLQFKITNPEFIRSSGLGDEGYSGVVRFKVTNSTIYNFYDPGFFVVLLNSSDIAGVFYTKLNSLKSFESVPLEVNITAPTSFVTGVRIIPDINVLDESIYFLEAPGTEPQIFEEGAEGINLEDEVIEE